MASTNAQVHRLGHKTIADVCEAMIGAAYLFERPVGSVDMAVKAVTRLVQSAGHTAESWCGYYKLYQKPAYQLAPATASQVDLARQIELKMGYRFKYPRLLRSAFIHPSYPFAVENVPNYQRLEFMGDALLDMTAIDFLFDRFPDKDPQWLTEHKMAMVSNRFMAALAVKLEFHKHLRSSSPMIEKQNREYVVRLNDAFNETNGAMDYWTDVPSPPKALSDVVESYVAAVFVDSEYDFKQVQHFFNQHIRPFFEDIAVYDTFASHHPVTLFHSMIDSSFGCKNYCLRGAELKSALPGEQSAESVAAVIIHGSIVATGHANSNRSAKCKAALQALSEIKNLLQPEFHKKYRCTCKGVVP